MTTQTVDAATSMTDPVVTQAAREAAAQLHENAFGPNDMSGEIRQGLHDCDPTVLAFAQAHLEGERAGMEKAARIALLEVFAEARDTEWDIGFNDAKRIIAAAIRNGAPS